ncbi:sodium/proton antiporter NhaB [Dongshaea marina]|uniref:sodium/proton antiporter NhaB n=1 Tax=Dongshaea marina TaxID=2047966 RepID=UPI000D3EB555|nr:sodium/proton antiporter NhaB [Dongshaea marina]
MAISLGRAFGHNFLGHSPRWYKYTIIACLVINPILFWLNPFVAGWLLVIQFIMTLAMALKCYPLQPGGLLAIEAVIIGMTSPAQVKHELIANIEVLLLLIFMVAGIYFMKDLLLYLFTKLLVRIRSKIALSVAFCFAAAVLSAFLDALTVIAVIISVAVGFYAIYHKVASGKHFTHDDHDHSHDHDLHELKRRDLDQFRAFLRSLMMHAAIGTALGGVCTLVGEPQNLIIGERAGWHFVEFAIRMSPVTFPVLICGLITCAILEKTHWFGYGDKLPESVRHIILEYDEHQDSHMSHKDYAKLIIQGVIALWLIVALALHLAAVGLIGLSVIILASAFTGVTEEHAIGKAFEEALPFTALLSVFFVIVAVIIDQHLFEPIIQWVLQVEKEHHLWLFYLANGVLSMVSDNVFVGTVYINEVKAALMNGVIDNDHFDMLAVAINTGTNLPSVATPNGQAAFLFLLTSTLAPLLRLSYGRMVWMALPYTIVLGIVGLIAISFLLHPMTQQFYEWGIISHHTLSEMSNAASSAH